MTCLFCQAEVDNRDAAIEHVYACEQHPMRAIEQKLRELQPEKGLPAWMERQIATISGDEEPQP